MLDNHLGSTWRDDTVMQATDVETNTSGEEQIRVTMVARETGGDQVTVPNYLWISLKQPVVKLSRKSENTAKEHEATRQELSQTKFKLEKVKNECPRNRLALGERNNRPSASKNIRAGMNEKFA